MTTSRDSVIRFPCPSCGGNIKAPSGQRGQRFHCPKCNVEVIAPGGSGEAARTTAAEPDVPRSTPAVADDDLPMLPSAGESGQGAKANQGRIWLRCPLCHTAVEADARKLGEAISCPQCTSPMVVSRPVEPAPAPPTPVEEVGDDISLEPAAEASPYHVMLPPELRGQGKPVAAAASPSRQLKVPPRRREYVVVCPLCGTRLDVSVDQVGQEIKCPDCYKTFAVPPPPPTRELLTDINVSADDKDTEFRLSETFERPKYQPLVLGSVRAEDMHLLSGTGTGGQTAQIIVACPECGQYVFATPDQLDKTMVCTACKAEVPVQKVASVGPPVARDSATRGPVTESQAAIQRAGREYAEREASQPKLPAQPLITGVFDFLKDAEAILRLVVLGMMLFLEFLLVSSAVIWARSGSGIQQFAAVACSIFAAIFGLITAATSSAKYLAIVEDTANGADRITSWPDWSFLEWVSQTPYVLVSLLLSALPGIVLSSLLDLVGAPDGTSALCIFLSIYICYPVIQLASLEADSALLPISAPVWQSLKTCSWHWWTFYGLSAVLFLGGTAVLLLLFTAIPGKTFIAGFAMAFITMLYYRLLGRLAWACQQTYTLLEEDDEEA